jgi:hypothetical protein
MVKLAELTEGAILHNLRMRSVQNEIHVSRIRIRNLIFCLHGFQFLGWIDSTIPDFNDYFKYNSQT